MLKKTLPLLGLIFCSASYADQYVFEKSEATQSANQVLSTSPITINRNFPTITSVVGKLNSLGMKASIIIANQREVNNQQISTNTSIADFVRVAASKFNYTATINGNSVVFKGLYPASASKATTKINSLANTSSASNDIAFTSNWTYSPNDKYISATLNRWAHQAGYQLVWQTQEDFAVQSSGTVSGSVKSAVNEVLRSFKNTEHPLKAEWFKNHVVVITDFGS